MNKQRPAMLWSLFALAAGSSLMPLNALADDGTTGTTANRYLSGTTVLTEDYNFDVWGSSASLSVGTGAGAGHLSVQNGAQVEVPGALFIAGKGYASSYRIEQGHDGLVTVGPGSRLECGSQVPHFSGAQVYVGWGSGVTGTMRVDGGEFVSNYILRVGCHEASNGLMEVLNGGRVTLGLGAHVADADTAFLSLATGAGSRGLLRVDGGSILEFALDSGERSRADVGAGGTGILLVEGGSRVSLGQDYAFIGVERGSEGFVHVRGGATLELPGITYMARDAGSLGFVMVEGSGSRLEGQDVAVGEQGMAYILLLEGGQAEVSGILAVGARDAAGRVVVSSGAQLITSGESVVGNFGMLRILDGGQWVSSAPVYVLDGGGVLLRGSGRWEAQAAVEFRPGSTLTFAVDSFERTPELAVATGAALTMSPGSRLLLNLSADLLEGAAAGEWALPLISGEFQGEGYTYELRDESGVLDTSDLRQLPDGRWGLSVTLDRAALKRTLADDAARLVNGLWSSTGVLRDYASALLDRPGSSRGRHIWAMGLGSFSHMDAHGGSPGFNFNGGGYAIGADTDLQERSTMGFSFGQVYGSNKSSDGITRIRQNSLMGSLYARYDSRPGEVGRRTVLDAYAAYGRTRNHARSAMFSTGLERSRGRWWDDGYALGLRASWERPLTEHSSLLPFIGLRYLHGSHGAFTMSSGERSRAYSSASLHTLSLPVGFTLRGRYELRSKQQLQPELTLAYVRDLSRNNPHLSTGMLDEYARSAGSVPGRDALMLRAGAGCTINEHWSAGLYYHLECRRHEVDQAVDLSVSYGF